jgi:hypothetical protein
VYDDHQAGGLSAAVPALPAPSVLVLLLPAGSERPCRLRRVELRAVSFSDAIGGGLLDDIPCGRSGGSWHTVYQDAERDTKGLPDNPRAWLLAARLEWPHLAMRLSLRGDVLVAGLDGWCQDADVPEDVLAAAMDLHLLPGVPSRPPGRSGPGCRRPGWGRSAT